MVEKPHLIFNVDEQGLTTNHKPPHVVAPSSYCPSAVTSGKGKTTTVIGCGSAAGQAIPPYFVFAGKRFHQDLLLGTTPGSSGTVSETGWSNGVVFRDYLENHFLKFVPVRDGDKVLLFLDGHRSHVSVGLCEWTLSKGIVLFFCHPTQATFFSH